METNMQKNLDTQADNTNNEAQLLAGKYHSVEALEQGYRELSRLVREKTPQVPEHYEVDFSHDPKLSNCNLAEDALWQHMTPSMKEAALTQDQAQKVAHSFMQYQLNEAEQEQARFAALGDEGVAMVRQVSHFMEKNLPQEEQQMVEAVGSSVAGLKLLHKLINLAGEQPVPIQNTGQSVSPSALKEKAFAMLKDPDMAHNPKKQAAYNRLWQDIANT